MTQTLLEIAVRQSNPSKREWRVLSDGSYPVVHGSQGTKQEATSEAESALFLLLAAGSKPQ